MLCAITQQAYATLEKLDNKSTATAKIIVTLLDEIFTDLDLLYIDPTTVSIEFAFDTTVGLFTIKEKEILLHIDMGGIERTRSVLLTDDWELHIKRWLISLRESAKI